MDAGSKPQTVSRADLAKAMAPLFPKHDAVEPTAEALRNTAKDLRALAGISAEERKHHVWFDTLRLQRAWVLAFGRWIERHGPGLLDRAPTLQTELAMTGWSRYDASTWLEIAQELERIALRIDAVGWTTKPSAKRPKELTVTEAAEPLDKALSLGAKATARVSKAVTDGKLNTNGRKMRARRIINDDKYRSWLLNQLLAEAERAEEWAAADDA